MRTWPHHHLLVLASFCIIAFFFLSSSLHFRPADSAGVLSFDFGTQWYKVALINAQKFDLVLDSQSQRKTSSLIGFTKEGDRIFGDGAKRLSLRFPEQVLGDLHRYLGRASNSSVLQKISHHNPFKFSSNDRGTVSVHYANKSNEESMMVEEPLAMLFQQAKDLAKNEYQSLKDVVIVVPAQLTEYEKQAYLDTAKIAGLNVLSLIPSGSAVAVNFALSRTDITADDKYVLFYDLGAGTLTVTLASFKLENSTGKTTSTSIQIHNTISDLTFGARDFDNCLAMHMAAHANKDLAKSHGDVTKIPRVMAKLRNEARSVKEVLSANKEINSVIEGLLGDYDFRKRITRKDFEDICDEQFKRALLPLDSIFEGTNITSSQVEYVELVGGGTRAPKLQDVLKKSLNRQGLDKHINGDEAAVLGAAFHGAVLSSTFKIKTSIKLKEHVPYPYRFEIIPDKADDSNLNGALFNNKLPVKRTLTFRMGGNFKIRVSYEKHPNLLDSQLEIRDYIFTKIPTNLRYNLTEKPKVSITLHLNSSGMVEIDKAEADVIYTVREKVKPKNDTKKTSDESNDGDEETKSSSESSSASSSDKPEYEDVKKSTKVKLDVDWKPIGAPRPMTNAQIESSRKILAHFTARDQRKLLLQKTKNSLESYLFAQKERMADPDEFLAEVTTEKQRDEFAQKLRETGEWFDDTMDDDPEVYQSKLDSVKSIGDSFALRISEIEARPAAIVRFMKDITTLKDTIANISDIYEISDVEVQNIHKRLEDDEKWFNEKLQLQESLQPTDDPAFTSKEIGLRLADTTTSLLRTIRRLKRKVVVTPPKVEESSNTTSDSTKPVEGETKMEEEVAEEVKKVEEEAENI